MNDSVQNIGAEMESVGKGTQWTFRRYSGRPPRVLILRFLYGWDSEQNRHGRRARILSGGKGQPPRGIPRVVRL